MFLVYGDNLKHWNLQGAHKAFIFRKVMAHFHLDPHPPTTVFLALLKEEESVICAEDTGMDEDVCSGWVPGWEAVTPGSLFWLHTRELKAMSKGFLHRGMGVSVSVSPADFLD